MKNKEASKLLKKLVEVFSTGDEISKIYSFGSISTKKADRYSDVDATVITNDIRKTTKQLVEKLKKIDQIMSIFTLVENKENVAYTIFFKNHSPYQKVDLGIVSSKSKTPIFENSRLEYENKKPTKFIVTKPLFRKETNNDHEIMDCVIGSLRYLKYIGRGETWPAYKFYRGFIEQYLKLKLNIQSTELLTLDSFNKIQKLRKKELTNLIFNKSEIEMSQTYLQYLKKYYIFSKTNIDKENSRFIQKILNYWKDELDRNSKKQTTRKSRLRSRA